MHVRPGILCLVRAFRSLWLVSSRVRPLELPAIGRRDVGFGSALLAGRTFSSCDEGRSMVLRTAVMRNVSQNRSLLARRLLSSFGRGSINQQTPINWLIDQSPFITPQSSREGVRMNQ